MTEEQFRIKHSELIAYYQYIEFHLKALCADLVTDENKSWFEHLNEYEADSFGAMLRELKGLCLQSRPDLFSEESLNALEALRERRNYWVHQCFIWNPTIVFRKGILKHPVHGRMLETDLRDAIERDERIVEIIRSIKK